MRTDWLEGHRTNVTSQFGEDGIIEKIFEVIGTQNKYCVEFGALDGKHHSNVWDLLTNKKWAGLLIEPDQTYFEVLKKRYAEYPEVVCLNTFVTFDGENTLDTLLEKSNAPKDLDLIIIDIDGNDIHIWESLKTFEPRVVVIEFNPSIPPNVSFTQSRDMSVQQGSSLLAMVLVGRQKGYELVTTTEVNAIFVKKEEYPKFGIEDNSPTALWRSAEFTTQLFQLYDGTLMIAGNTNMIWHKRKIDTTKIQVLPKRKRFYPAGTSSNNFVRAMKYYFRKIPIYGLIQKVRKSFS